jgi:hypothetical protein
VRQCSSVRQCDQQCVGGSDGHCNVRSVRAAVCGSVRLYSGWVRYDSARGSVRLSGSAAVCGSAAVQIAVCGSAHGSVRLVRAVVCGSTLGSVLNGSAALCGWTVVR